MNEFLHVLGEDSNSEHAILLIPDIWGLTDYNRVTAQSFADKYHRPCYTLDYFYQITAKPSKFDSAADSITAPALMNKMTGDDFFAIFNKAIDKIKDNQPNLESIAVVGFCFGGRLAYLAGLEKLVDKIVSFYGVGATKPDFYQHKSAVDALCESRAGDTNLKVLAFYGLNDESITESDRQTVATIMQTSHISYKHHEFPAGHAYFQAGRSSYDDSSARQSSNILDKFFE